MSKTVADASRDYRQRRAEKLERYEAALREIARLHLTGHVGDIARNALHIEVL